jgi:DNA-binding HxlR family transcriptional regulator
MAVKNIISGLNKVFESRIRLGIMSVLMVNESIDYNSLKELLDVTDGNLASHIANLEKHEMIIIEKQFIGKKPNTKYRATENGKKLFNEHLKYLNKLIQENE